MDIFSSFLNINKNLDKLINDLFITNYKYTIYGDWGLGIGDWGLGIGDWGLGPIPNPQSPIPNPQSPYNFYLKHILNKN